MTTASSPRQVRTMQGGDRHDGRARAKKLPGILGDFNLLPIEDCRRCRREDKLSPIQKDGLCHPCEIPSNSAIRSTGQSGL